MKTLANTQTFQSIYIDPDADWRNRIVFLDPMFEAEIPGVVALKSLRLEDLAGCVMSGAKPAIRAFRKRILDTDDERQLGKSDSCDAIIDSLVDLAEDMQLTVAYRQPAKENRIEAFFDPLTKRRIVEKGVHYFDPSLPTVEDVEELAKSREALFGYGNPASTNYPRQISEPGRVLWRKVMMANRTRVYRHKDRSKKWKVAIALLEEACEKLGVPPFVPRPLTSSSLILSRLKESAKIVKTFESNAYSALTKAGLVEACSRRPILHDVTRSPDGYVLTTVKHLRLLRTSPEKALSYLTKHLQYRSVPTSHLNVVKMPNLTTAITASEQSSRPNHVALYASYLVPPSEARTLFETDQEAKIIPALYRLGNRWLKTKRLTTRML